MSIYRPKGSKVWVMDFMFHSQRIREIDGDDEQDASERSL